MRESEKGSVIGGVRTANRIWLAPMAGVTNRPYRDFHRRAGAGLAHTEMISAVGLSYKNKKTIFMLGEDEEDGPTALQLFGPDADRMAAAAEMALRCGHFCALEVNMACPMPKVTKKCGGAAMLSNPEEAARMMRVLKTLGLPVWVKVRKTDERVHPMSTENFCSLLLEHGADLLIIHGRTPAQRYEGEADKSAVISAAVKFPGAVAASGDFFSPEDAEYYLDNGCAAVLAARGVIKDAFLIPRTLAHLGAIVDRRFLRPSAAEQIEMILEACGEAKSIGNGRPSLVTARRLMCGMLKGIPGVSSLRRVCSLCGDFESFERILTGFVPAAW
jgi:tRNA-dihydrouridine synthase B